MREIQFCSSFNEKSINDNKTFWKTIKVTVMHIVKALIMISDVFQKYPKNFTFQLFIILQ